ncbi:hypothetical protein ACIA5C_44975 [Actinoplanes sp. NPDC051343]|uniref:hypothetical protein n=1 Tax=Actinoplanes sp. NPDC051343 TaxID=3363906 RepID=UPI00378A6F80
MLSRSARPDLAGALSVALGIEVVAPTGTVILLPPGLLFVDGGIWQAYRAGAVTARYGARHPAPDWETTLEAGPGHPFVVIPAGVWLPAAEHRAGPLPAPVLAVPVQPEQASVLIGDPSGWPENADAALELLPRAMRRRLTLVPYGPASTRIHDLGERLARRSGGVVEVIAGVPDTDEHGRPVVSTIDEKGSRGWRPAGVRFAYRAASAPTLVASVGPQWWTVDPTWAIEVVRCGYWLRDVDNTDAAADARWVPAHPEHPLLYLGSFAMRHLHRLPALLDQATAMLAPEVVVAMRLVAARAPEPGEENTWAELTDRFGDLLTVVGARTLVVLPVPPAPASIATEAPPPGSPTNPAVGPESAAIMRPGPRAQGSGEVAPGTSALEDTPAGIPQLSDLVSPATIVQAHIPPSPPAPPDRQTSAVAVCGPAAVTWPVHDPLPNLVITAPLAPAPAAPPDHLTVVWSLTGRALPGSEVAFTADRRFRTLDVMTADPRWSQIVLLREVPPSEEPEGPPDSYVRDALWRLAEAMRRAPHHGS